MESNGALAVTGDDGMDGEVGLDTPSIIRLLRVFVGAATDDGDDVHPSPCRKRPRPDKNTQGEDSASCLTSPWKARESAGCTLWDLSASETDAARMCSAGLLPVACAVLRQCAPPFAGEVSAALSVRSEDHSTAQGETSSAREPAEQPVQQSGGEAAATTMQSPSHNSTPKQPETGPGRPAVCVNTAVSTLLAEPGAVLVEADSIGAGSAATAAKADLHEGAPLQVQNETSSEAASKQGLDQPTCQSDTGSAAASEVGAAVDGHGGGAMGLEPDEACRLREITCGMLANTCTHRRLREQVVDHGVLGEELLRVLHTSDDPACLTETLRIFSSVAGVCSAGGGGVNRGALAAGLVASESLERLVFFLENSLEEKLLAQACSLTYVLMYRCGDVVVRPLVQELGVEQALAALLHSRRTDLSYEQVGGTETGLDVLLRCVEVLSTAEVSCLGPGSTSGNVGAREMDASTGAVLCSVIQGLVATLMPWEHSKNSQEAALLVLGNILDNALENAPDRVSDDDRSGVPDGTAAEGAVGPSTSSCVREGETPVSSKRRCIVKQALLDALIAQAPAVETEDGGDRDGLLDDDRLAVKKKEFLDNIAHLCGDDAALSDDLREELLEAAGIVLKALRAE